MTTTEIIELVAKYQEQTKDLKAHFPSITEVQWHIPDVSPELMADIGRHFRSDWFRSHDTMVVHVHQFGESLVSIRSVPVKIRETFEYIKL